MKFGIGDSVKVKAGVMCPDDESISISGWQGRIFEIDECEGTVGIRWDGVTLGQLPTRYIKDGESEGLDWSEMYLDADEIETVGPRDSEEDADKVRRRMQCKYRWLDGDEADERIFAVVANVGEDEELDAWGEHLSRSLVFPFDAEVAESNERYALRHGDRVRVHGLDDADEPYGVLVDIEHERERFIFRLCDLNVVDRKSRNYLPVRDYCFWFTNR